MAQSRYYSATAVPTALTANITNANVAINVATATGFPPSVPFIIAVDYGTPSEEVCLVTAVAGTTFTVTRGYDGTSATSHNVGAPVRHTWTAMDGNDSRAHEGSAQGVHGIGGTSFVVGTLDTQTLTNKTLTSPIINGSVNIVNPNITGTVTGGASYTGITATSPTITGTVGGSASYTAPTITGNVPGNPTFTAGLAAGSTGQFSVNTNGDIVTSGIGSRRYDAQNADQPVVSSTTLVNSTIVVPVEANATYAVSGYIAYDGQFGGNGGLKAALTGPAGYSQSVAFNGPGSSGVAPVEYASSNVTAGNFATYGTYGTGSVKTTLHPSGFVTTAGTAGNITFQFAQNVSTATATTVYAGSFLLLTRVA